MVGNIVASVVKNKATPLQLAIGILFHHSKTTISHLYDYRVTLSNDEVQRFKKSATVHSAKSNSFHGVSQNEQLFQVVDDNYDTEMSSQNNKLVCHSLATIFRKNGEYPSQMLIPSLKTQEMTVLLTEPEIINIILQEMTVLLTEPEIINIIHYFGQRNLPCLAFPKLISTILLSICSKIVVLEPK